VRPEGLGKFKKNIIIKKLTFFNPEYTRRAGRHGLRLYSVNKHMRFLMHETPDRNPRRRNTEKGETQDCRDREQGEAET
jgi:hypothetical protein